MRIILVEVSLIASGFDGYSIGGVMDLFNLTATEMLELMKNKSISATEVALSVIFTTDKFCDDKISDASLILGAEITSSFLTPSWLLAI